MTGMSRCWRQFETRRAAQGGVGAGGVPAALAKAVWGVVREGPGRAGRRGRYLRDTGRGTQPRGAHEAACSARCHRGFRAAAPASRAAKLTPQPAALGAARGAAPAPLSPRCPGALESSGAAGPAVQPHAPKLLGECGQRRRRPPALSQRFTAGAGPPTPAAGACRGLPGPTGASPRRSRRCPGSPPPRAPPTCCQAVWRPRRALRGVAPHAGQWRGAVPHAGQWRGAAPHAGQWRGARPG